jgi:hypothetical protein
MALEQMQLDQADFYRYYDRLSSEVPGRNEPEETSSEEEAELKARYPGLWEKYFGAYD